MKNNQKNQKLRIGKLKSAQDVAKYMARCIRRAERGEGDTNECYKLVMMASMMLKAFEAGGIEQRVRALEERNGVK